MARFGWVVTGGGRRVAIVGAGPAGLAAAYRLQCAGASVVVFEARPEVGGRTRTDEVDGYRIDAATQLFGSSFTGFFALLDELGARDLALRSSGRDALWRDGRAHEVVYGSVTSMLASGGLSLRTKMRLGASYLPYLTRHADSLDPHAPERAAAAGLDRESIAAWGERELGTEFVENLAYPLLASYHGLEPEETSAALYHMLARTGLNVAVFALRGGSAAFCQLLGNRLRQGGGEVRTASRATAVETDGGEVRISGEAWDERFDAAVIATPAPEAALLVQSVAPTTREWLQQVSFRPAISLALLLDAPAGVRYFGLSFPRYESRTIAAVCVQENKAPGLVPANRGLLVVFPTPDACERLAGADGRVLLDAVLPDLRRALPGIDRRIGRALTFRWPNGWPIFRPGYFARLHEAVAGAVDRERQLAFAGDYMCFPSVEGAVWSGMVAAERAMMILEDRR